MNVSTPFTNPKVHVQYVAWYISDLNNRNEGQEEFL